MSTENGPKSVATEGPKNQENPKPWKKRTKIIPRGGPKHQTQDEEEKFTGNSQEILGKPPGYSQRIQDRSANQTANPLVNEALRNKQQRKKPTMQRTKRKRKKESKKRRSTIIKIRKYFALQATTGRRTTR